MSFLSGLSAQNVVPEPFPHLVVDDVLPQALADELARTFPPLRSFTRWKPYGSNQKIYRPAPAVLADPRVSLSWKSYLAPLGASILGDCLRLFGPHLLAEYPDFEARFGRLESLRLTAHDPKGPGPEVFLSSMLQVHTPVLDEPSIERGPHVKVTRSVFLGYLNLRLPGDASDGADQMLYSARPGAALEFDHTQATNPALLEPRRIVPRRHNSLFLFMNSARSIQGLTARAVTPFPLVAHHFVLRVGEPLFELSLAPGVRLIEPGNRWSLSRTVRVLRENAHRRVRLRLRRSP